MMHPDNAILTEVQHMLVERFELQKKPEELTAQTKIISEGLGFDSIAVLDIIAGIEQRFDVMVEDEDLMAEHFDSIGSLTRFVSSLLDKKANT